MLKTKEILYLAVLIIGLQIILAFVWDFSPSKNTACIAFVFFEFLIKIHVLQNYQNEFPAKITRYRQFLWLNRCSALIRFRLLLNNFCCIFISEFVPLSTLRQFDFVIFWFELYMRSIIASFKFRMHLHFAKLQQCIY